MTEIPEAPSPALPEAEPSKASLASRFKRIGVLFVVALALLVFAYISKPYKQSQTGIIEPTGVPTEVNSEPLSPAPLPEQVDPPPPITDGPFAPIISPEIPEPTPSPVPMPTPLPPPVENVQPAAPADAAISGQLQQLGNALSQKDKKIAMLQCALQIQSYASLPDGLTAPLKQCYALLVDAGVSQGDIKKLTEASMRGGVPDKEEMWQKFHEAIPAAMRIREKNYTEESNWYRALHQRITDALIIRKTGWQEGDSIEAIIGRAEFYLRKDGLGEAESELEKLSDNAKRPFHEWLELVEMHHALNRVLDLLIKATNTDSMEQYDGH